MYTVIGRNHTRSAAVLLVAALAGGAVASAADDPPAKAARAATAQASAYAQDDGDGTPTGSVSVSGNGSRANSSRGTSVRASTADYKGSASASARVEEVSLFDDLVTADLASVRATASGSARGEGGRVRNLVVVGTPQGSPTGRTTYDLQGYGKLVVLDERGRGIVALEAKLTKRYGSYPAGSVARVAYAAAEATDGTPPPKPSKPDKPDKPDPKPDKPSKPDKSDGSKPSKAGDKKPAKRRKPSRTKVLLTNKGFVFPIYGKHTYSDDWGAARADTGIHEGNDIFATAGTPVVAVCDGALNRVGTLPISGNRLWVKCSETGDSFFYAHLSAFATDTRNKLRVKAGQVLGFVGSTGDAEQTPPHLHFEVHPGDRDAVDPYPFLKAWESHRDVPAAAWVRENGRIGEQPGTLVVVKDFLSR
jgi:murein DD-endopeptidase MepM/ murein hydrolase activator NlpD